MIADTQDNLDDLQRELDHRHARLAERDRDIERLRRQVQEARESFAKSAEPEESSPPPAPVAPVKRGRGRPRGPRKPVDPMKMAELLDRALYDILTKGVHARDPSTGRLICGADGKPEYFPPNAQYMNVVRQRVRDIWGGRAMRSRFSLDLRDAAIDRGVYRQPLRMAGADDMPPLDMENDDAATRGAL